MVWPPGDRIARRSAVLWVRSIKRFLRPVVSAGSKTAASGSSSDNLAHRSRELCSAASDVGTGSGGAESIKPRRLYSACEDRCGHPCQVGPPPPSLFSLGLPTDARRHP